MIVFKSIKGDNPITLHGALVGGPDRNDAWEDDRGDFISNEVATDYNAAWQGLLAGLIQVCYLLFAM